MEALTRWHCGPEHCGRRDAQFEWKRVQKGAWRASTEGNEGDIGTLQGDVGEICQDVDKSEGRHRFEVACLAPRNPGFDTIFQLPCI
jgi:hypothetical protein